MQKKFFLNIDVSIPWGGLEDFLGCAKPTFAVTRKLLKVDGQVWCQTMQNSWFPISSLNIFIAYLQQKKSYEQKNKKSTILLLKQNFISIMTILLRYSYTKVLVWWRSKKKF